jgi:hypothetical protein
MRFRKIIRDFNVPDSRIVAPLLNRLREKQVLGMT